MLVLFDDTISFIGSTQEILETMAWLKWPLSLFAFVLLSLMIANIILIAQVRIKTGNLEREAKERRQAEKQMQSLSDAMEERQSFLQSVFNAIGDGISILDKDLQIIRVNSQMEKMYSLQAPLVGKRCYRAYQNREIPCTQCPSLRSMETGEPHHETVPYTIGERRKGWIDLSTYPFYDSEGDLIGVIEYVRDVTNKRKTEKKLRREKYFSSSLLQVSPAFFVAIAPDGKTININDAMLQVLGYGKDEVIGKDYLETFVPACEHEAVKETFGKLSGPHGPAFTVYHVVGKNGRQFLVEWHGRSMLKENKSLDFIFFFGIDITERKRLEEQLIQAQKMDAIGRLAGGIAHDFNNLLTVILGSNQILLDGFASDDPQRIESEEIQDSAKHAVSLTRQLLAFSRKQMLEQQVLNLNVIITDIYRILQRLIGENIELATELDPDLWDVKADPGQIEQVIVNLVINARDSMIDGGKIVFKTENMLIDEKYCKSFTEARPGKYVCFSVGDQGGGIDKKVLSHIFEPFFTTKECGEGTGLGLAVVYGIVKQHEGWINVGNEGWGTTFSIYLPKTLIDREIQRDEELMIRPQGNGERILLVEDEEKVRDFTRKLLSKNNYSVTEVSDAEEALEVFMQEERKFDLLFSDVALPGQNGLQLAERVIADNPYIRVLLTSGYTGHKSQWRAIKEKGYPFIQKPYSITDLLQTIRSAMEYS